MLTPQEVAEKMFDKVIVGGYDMEAVDAFLETVEKDYGQLYKENIVLKSKMKALLTKIEEYQNMDESMRKALLSAQNMASSIIEKAKEESANIEKAAQAKAEEKLASYQGRIAAEEMRLEETKTGVQAFVERMIGMYEKELSFLRGVKDEEFHGEPEIAVPAPVETAPAAAVPAEPAPAAEPAGEVTAPAEPAAETAAEAEAEPVQETDASVSEPVSETVPAEPVQEAPKTAVLPDTVPLPNIPPVPTLEPRRTEPRQPQVLEGDLTQNADLPNSVKRTAHGEDGVDDEEVIMLTPKPRFEFRNLQFGENYDGGLKKKK